MYEWKCKEKLWIYTKFATRVNLGLKIPIDGFIIE